jgi:hypothetical protein
MSNSTGLGRGFPAHHLFPLELGISVDLVVGEHVARVRKARSFSSDKRLAQASAHGRHFGQLLRRQVVEVLVHRVARMDLVLDPVEPGHQQRRIAR